MNRKLIFLDIDGTIQTFEHGIRREVKEGLKKVRTNGHQVFICTGRSHIMLPEGLDDIEPDGIIASAGSDIWIHDKNVYRKTLPPELIRKTAQVIESVGGLYVLEGAEKTFLSGDMDDLMKDSSLEEGSNAEMIRWRNFFRGRVNACSVDQWTEEDPVPKITFMLKHKEDQQVVARALEEDFHVVFFQIGFASIYNGELIPRTDTKGTAIHKVAEHYGIDIADTIAFGDSMNDLPMIEEAGCGVVMGNGEERLKAYADRICETVEEDGVIRELERMGLI